MAVDYRRLVSLLTLEPTKISGGGFSLGSIDSDWEYDSVSASDAIGQCNSLERRTHGTLEHVVCIHMPPHLTALQAVQGVGLLYLCAHNALTWVWGGAVSFVSSVRSEARVELPFFSVLYPHCFMSRPSRLPDK